MGLEQKACKATIGKKECTGKLHVDGQLLEFRTPDQTWSVPVGKGTRASCRQVILRVSRGSKSAEFDVGDKGDRWVQKILNPPTRATKLGLKQGQKFYQAGADAGFIDELLTQSLLPVRSVKSCDLAFIFLQRKKDLETFDRAFQSASTGTHFWLVWPKGVKVIRQADVLAQAKSLGMGPGKVMSFDPIRTAMRFTKK